jgi:hypothetical protein
MSFNFLKGLQYLSEAAQAGAVVESTQPHNAADYINEGIALTQIFDPKEANDPNFQAAEKMMAILTAAENGSSATVSTIPFQSHGVELKMTISIGPA